MKACHHVTIQLRSDPEWFFFVFCLSFVIAWFLNSLMVLDCESERESSCLNGLPSPRGVHECFSFLLWGSMIFTSAEASCM